MHLWYILLLAVVFIFGMAGITQGNNIENIIPVDNVLKQIEIGESVNYDNVVIDGNLDQKLYNLTVTSPVVITNSYINGTVTFKNAIFEKDFRINGTRIKGIADFSGSKFNWDSYFVKTEFINSADFSGSKFSGDAFFWGTRFNKTVDFSESSFFGHTSFWESQFKGYALFYKLYFNKTVDFSRSKFCEDAYFVESQFNKIIDFRWSEFEKNVSFDMSQLDDTARYNESSFLGNAYFRGCQFNDTTHFDKAVFLRDADLSDSKFSKDASFEETQFNGYASFLRSNFGGRSNFLAARFDNDADFIESQFNRTAEFSCSRFDRDSDFLVTWNNIRDHLNCGDPVYQVLIRSFRNSGLFGDADDCYYQRMEHLSASSETDLTLKLFWLSCGYGVRPIYSIYLSLLLIIIFGLGYWIGDGIKKSKEPEAAVLVCDYPSPKEVVLGICQQRQGIGFARLKHHLNLFLIALHSPGGLLNSIKIRVDMLVSARRSASIGDALYFSALVFFVALPPPAWSIRGNWRYIIILEDVLGWLLMTIFVVALGNVVIR